MRIGVTFPQAEITSDPGAVRAYAEAAEALGYSHLLAYDHVIGADTSDRPDWGGPYTVDSLFHEPFVLFGYLAGVTQTLEFVTGILILPQRQTVLVAKQAAEVAVLSGGQLRLGVGLGWNAVEYEALNENFRNRGKRSEEQIEVLRALFSQKSVTFKGRWHHIEAAGIKPLPAKPVPIWLGGHSEAAMRRAAAIADGWFPTVPPDRAVEVIEQIRGYAREAGRDPGTLGVEARVSINTMPENEWASAVQTWRDAGATHLAVNTMNAGLKSPDEHIEAIKRFKEVVG